MKNRTDCIISQSVYGCGRPAEWRDKNPLKKGREKRYLCYCDRHKKEGVEWGWLEEDEMERI